MGEQECLQKGIGTLPDMLCEMNHRVHLAPPFVCSRQLWIIIQCLAPFGIFFLRQTCEAKSAKVAGQGAEGMNGGLEILDLRGSTLASTFSGSLAKSARSI